MIGQTVDKGLMIKGHFDFRNSADFLGRQPERKHIQQKDLIGRLDTK